MSLIWTPSSTRPALSQGPSAWRTVCAASTLVAMATAVQVGIGIGSGGGGSGVGIGFGIPIGGGGGGQASQRVDVQMREVASGRVVYQSQASAGGSASRSCSSG